MANITLELFTTDFYTTDKLVEDLVNTCHKNPSILQPTCPIDTIGDVFKCPFDKECSEITPSDWLNIIQR